MAEAPISYAAFKTISVKKPAEYVAHVELNRPEKRNAIDMDMWR